MKKRKIFLLTSAITAVLLIFLSFFTTFTGSIIASAMENEWNAEYIFSVKWMPKGMNLKTFIQSECEQMQFLKAERIRIETEERRQAVSKDKMSSVADEVYRAFCWIVEAADTDTLTEQYKKYENSLDLSSLEISKTEQTELKTFLTGLVKNACMVFDKNAHYASISENQLGALRACVSNLHNTESKMDETAYIQSENFTLAAFTSDSSDFNKYETDYINATRENDSKTDYDYLCTYERTCDIPEYGPFEITVQAFVCEDSAAIVSVGITEPDILRTVYGGGNIRCYNPQYSIFESAEKPVIADVDAAISAGDAFSELLVHCLKAGIREDVYRELESEYAVIEEALTVNGNPFEGESEDDLSENRLQSENSEYVVSYYNELKEKIDNEFDKYKSYTPNRYLGLLLEESLYMAMTSCDSELGYLADNIRLFLSHIDDYELKHSQVIMDAASDKAYTKMKNIVTAKLGSYGYAVYPVYAVHLEYEIKETEFSEEELVNFGEEDIHLTLELDVLSAEDGMYITNFTLSAPKLFEDWFTCNARVDSYQYDNLYVMIDSAYEAVDRSLYDSDAAYDAAVENWLETTYPQYFSNTDLAEETEDNYVAASRRMRNIGNEIAEGAMDNVIGAINGIIDETADMAQEAAWSVSDIISQIERDADMAAYILKQEFNYRIGNYLKMELHFAKKAIEEGIDDFKEAVSDAWHNLFR